MLGQTLRNQSLVELSLIEVHITLMLLEHICTFCGICCYSILFETRTVVRWATELCQRVLGAEDAIVCFVVDLVEGETIVKFLLSLGGLITIFLVYADIHEPLVARISIFKHPQPFRLVQFLRQ